MIRRMKLHRMIEHLKAKGFYHDAQDFEDGVENVLADYGIDEEFSYEELREIERDLMVVAELNELYEIERVVNETDGAQPSVSSSASIQKSVRRKAKEKAKGLMKSEEKEREEKPNGKKCFRCSYLPPSVEAAYCAMHCEEI